MCALPPWHCEMSGDGEPFGAVLTAEVIEAIELRHKHLGSPTLTPAEVAAHKTKKSCYIRVLDYVFDVTVFLKRHPGGELILLQNAGDRDCAKIFASIHSGNAGKMLPNMLVGTISEGGRRATGDDQRPTIADSGHGVGKGQEEINSAAASEYRAPCKAAHTHRMPTPEPEPELPLEEQLKKLEELQEYSSGDFDAAAGDPRGVLFENEATTAAMEQTLLKPTSSATRKFQARPGETLDAKTVMPELPGQTSAGAESKCPFAAILKAAGHDIEGMSMPANHKAAHGMHDQLPTGSPLAGSSDAAGLFKERPRGGGWGIMSDLPPVPENRPMVEAYAVEDEDEFESAPLSPLGGTSGRQRSSVDSVELQGQAGANIFRGNIAGSSKLSGPGGQVFKFSLQEAASSRHSHSSATGSKLSGAKKSSTGRAAARKRRLRAARARDHKIDMDEWNRRVAIIKDFWENLLKDVSLARLGTSLLNTVDTDDTLEPLFRYSNKELHGTKFMDMLCSIVDNINSPEMIFAKIGDLGGMHHRLGVRADYMPIMKEALFSTFQQEAGGIVFTEKVQEAWTYVWDTMTVAMAQALEDEGSTLTLVMDSWEMITEHKTSRDLGELLYDYLFTLVPNVRHMFTKSREEMAITMGEALEMIISCAENSGSLEYQLRSLGLRHVTYKVHPHHIPLMGPPLMSVLAEQLGGDWNPEVERAWAQLFEVVSDTMATSIREGKDQGGAVHELIRNTQERAKVDLSMWEAADKDGSGSIGFDEFASMSCHVGISKAKIKKIFDKLDVDGSGELDKDEFSHYKAHMDRETSIGHFITSELAASAPDLVLLMKEHASGSDKVERAASTLSKRKRKHAAQGDLTSLFEVSGASLAAKEQRPLALAASKARECIPAEGRNFRTQSGAGGKGLLKFKTAYNAVHAVQDLGKVERKTSYNAVHAVQGMMQPTPTQTEASVALPEPVAPEKGSKLKKLLYAVWSVVDIKSHVGAPHSGNNPTSAGGGSSPLDPSHDRSLECQEDGNAPEGKSEWKKALTAVKTTAGIQKMFAENKLEQQPGDHTADFVGAELWDFVCETAELIYVPQKRRELIFMYANSFYMRGMRSEHLLKIGKAIESVFRHTLPFDQYAEKQRVAWEWLWSDLSHSLGHELDVIDKDWSVLVLESWELIQQRADVDVLGREFWKRLNEIAPDQTHVFRRPLKMWGYLLHHIVNMLSVSISSPDTFFDQMFHLTVRHIRYGVRQHYLPPFGKALMETFEHILKDLWTAETRQAWEEVWKRAADSFLRVLSFGSSPLVHALVDGSVDRLRGAFAELEHQERAVKLCQIDFPKRSKRVKESYITLRDLLRKVLTYSEPRDAIAEFPRQDRSVKLCQIDIEKAKVSPLLWALHDGKHELVNFILNDLLTIRADLNGYYYGRELLFKHHPDLVGILGRNEQQLLRTLLDGLLWHSREKTDRKVRVSYFIAELYGRPDEYDDPWDSPLAGLVKFADNTTFAHPVVCKVLEIKWQSYGMKLFLLEQAWYMQTLILYLIEENGAEKELENYCDNEVRIHLRRALMVLSIINTLMQFSAWAVQMYHGKVTTVEVWGRNLSMPRTAANVWPWLRLASWITISLIYATYDCEVMSGFLQPCLALENGSYAPEGCREDSRSVIYTKNNLTSSVYYHHNDGLEWRQLGGVQKDRALLALSGMLLWGQVLECSILSAPMAAFTFSLGIMISDLSHSLFFIGILLLAFGSALTRIADEGYDQGLDVTLAALIKQILDMGQSPEGLSGLTVFLLIIFFIFVTIIMLNVLIAQLSLTYGKVMNFARPSMLKYRASVTLDLESLLPVSLRQRVYDSLAFDVPLPLSVSDVGPSGGIQGWEWEAECPGYIPDRIKRYTGDASPQDPWPKHESES